MLKKKLAALSARERIEVWNLFNDFSLCNMPGEDHFYLMSELDDLLGGTDVADIIKIARSPETEHFDAEDEFFYFGYDWIQSFNSAEIDDWIPIDDLAALFKCEDYKTIVEQLANERNLY